MTNGSVAGALKLVLLHHTGIPTPHYDLMFETAPGSMLTTFRFPSLPSQTRTMIEKLQDHRREYFDYEGPISGGRGEVRRLISCWFVLVASRSEGLDITGMPIVESYSLTLHDPQPPFDRHLQIINLSSGKWQAWNEPY
jgi:hypothetical protein